MQQILSYQVSKIQFAQATYTDSHTCIILMAVLLMNLG